MQEIIKVKNLSKVFNKPIRGNGLKHFSRIKK